MQVLNNPMICRFYTPFWCGILLVLLLTVACSESKTELGNENFEQFQQRFFEDRAFQMSRVLFPLPERLPNAEEWEADDTASTTPLIKYWHPAQWQTLVCLPPNSDSLLVETQQTDTTWTQRARIPETEAYAEMRFRRIRGQWFLIYFLANE